MHIYNKPQLTWLISNSKFEWFASSKFSSVREKQNNCGFGYLKITFLSTNQSISCGNELFFHFF